MGKFKIYGKTYSKIAIPINPNLGYGKCITIVLSYSMLMKWRAAYKDTWEFGATPESAIGNLIAKLFGVEV